ncbi:MAG: Rieske (2Fe-2S) protein [Leptospirales bacterium]|nr:Rieske (2Fe-2S) protein [Leptospirales bacterium]
MSEWQAEGALRTSSGWRNQFGDQHRYDPELVFEAAGLIAGSELALLLPLPDPPNGDREDEAFFYRLDERRVVGYFNRCTHIQAPMDFGDGRFLDPAGFILCRLHGARYELANGEACAGPARGNLARVLCQLQGTQLIVSGWQKIRSDRNSGL